MMSLGCRRRRITLLVFGGSACLGALAACSSVAPDRSPEAPVAREAPVAPEAPVAANALVPWQGPRPPSTADARLPGAACAFSSQCASGRCSVDGATTSACGECLDVRKLGERCDG